MSELSSTKKVTPWELLDVRERNWRPRLDAVSLAAECLDEIPQRRREQVLVAFGRLYEKAEFGGARERLLRRWPAAHILSTAGVAADHYERATFWPKLTNILQITQDPDFQREWGEAFLDNLRRLGLPTFENDDDAGTRYVGRILLHAGMPTYCLDDFFRILAWKRSVTPGLTPEEFISWAAGRAAGSGLKSVDVPVRRFVRYGDEFAVDVAERSFELLDAIATGSATDDVPLPERFCTAAEELHESRAMSGAATNGRLGGSQREIRPRLIVDPFGLGLLLRLPPVGDAPDGKAVWTVTLDEETHRVATESLWPGSTEPAPQTDVPITKPVRSASVALAGREHLQLPLIVIDDKNPLLAFSDDGELIPASIPLPAAKVWLLLPGDVTSLRARGAAEVLAESPLPPRWSGFTLLHVNLADAVSVTVGTSTRTVRKLEAAHIETATPVQGVRTTSGLPVIAELPRICIPDSMANANWDVTLFDSDGVVVARDRFTGSDDPNSLWHNASRPMVGQFIIRVRGPWGRGTSRTFNLVEGLSVAFSPRWRRFVPGGLQPCTVRFRAANGVELSRDQTDLDERKRETVLRAAALSRYRSLVVTPPHMTVAYQAENFAISPSVRPLPLAREDVRESPGEIVLDIGSDAEPSIYVIANNRAVQKLATRGGRAGIYRFDLGEVTDTLREHPQVVLALTDDGELPISIVRPRTLFTGVELDHSDLVFENCVDINGLCVYLFPTRAPWREPACAPIIGGRAALPDWLTNAGPMHVMARIEDPWVPLPVPDWPQPGTSRLVESEGWVKDGTAEETAISMFLAGNDSEPVDVIDFERLWTVRALLPSLGLGPRIGEISEAIDTEIYANPAAALATLTGSEAPSDAIPSLMIRSGLAWANLAEAHDKLAPPWTLRGALPAALLSAADSIWSSEEIEAAISVCGAAVNGLLDGEDPYPSAGRIDESAELLDRTPALREQFIREARIVPQGLLSEDSRVLAAIDLVTRRKDPRLAWLVGHARSILKEGERLLRIIGDERSQRAFDARRHPSKIDGWHVVPAISLALALAARHAARGHADATRWVVREQRPWADLASVVPQLVTTDLIIAELVVGHRAEDPEGPE